MSLTFESTESPSAADLAIVDAGIGEFNASEPELHQVQPLCVFARDETGQVKGGAAGRTWGLCCELQQLWVAEDARGQGIGTELMHRFEAEAQRRDCSLIYLDTFTFQAKPFYQRRGYLVALETSGFTNGIVKYTMHKRLGAQQTEA
jgi:GNAT superfamily N-acetyltransferase